MRPKKIDLPGHAHFVTTNTYQRYPLFLSRRLAQIVVDSLLFAQNRYSLVLIAYVIMPDHWHALIWPQMPETVRPQIETVRPQIETVRPQIETVRPQIETVRPQIETVRPQTETVRPQIETVRPQIETVRPELSSGLTVSAPPPTAISKIMQGIKRHTARQIINILQQESNLAALDPLSLPENLASWRQQAIPHLSPDRFPTLLDLTTPRPRQANHQYRIWQESFYDFNVFTDHKLAEKVAYMQANPLRWGLAQTPEEYSFFRCLGSAGKLQISG